jgi:hypothetical protein
MEAGNWNDKAKKSTKYKVPELLEPQVYWYQFYLVELNSNIQLAHNPFTFLKTANNFCMKYVSKLFR